MKIIIHPPTVEGPEGTADVAAVVLSAIRQAIRDLGEEDDPSAAADSFGKDSASARHPPRV